MLEKDWSWVEKFICSATLCSLEPEPGLSQISNAGVGVEQGQKIDRLSNLEAYDVGCPMSYIVCNRT